MAKSKFINYLAYAGVHKKYENCTPSPNQGIINFDIHFTENATINLNAFLTNKTEFHFKSLGDIKDKDNIYTFSVTNFLENINTYRSLNHILIMIVENKKSIKITLENNDEIIGKALKENNNIYFRFSYDINDPNCKQFNNCILYIEGENNDNYTYMNWISPIASGNDIKPYITGTTSSESSSSYNDDTQFEGSLEKCIKAISSSTWISAFKEPDAKNENGYISIPNCSYNGKIKSSPSKIYNAGNLVRF